MTSFPLNKRFFRALELAHTWHHGQYRKVAKGETETIPYISHLLGVASIALEFGATEAQAIAALLHDALEDGPKNTDIDAKKLRELIVNEFPGIGEEVAKMVDACTDAMPKANEKKAPWEERKRKYLASLAGKDAGSLLVSASDKLHNARAILTDVLTVPLDQRDNFFNRFNQGKMGTLQYYRLLVDKYQEAPNAAGHPRLQALFAELDRTVTTLESICGVTASECRDHSLLKPIGNYSAR